MKRISDEQREVVIDGVVGFVVQEYFDGDRREWTTDANGNTVGMMYFKKFEPRDRLMGVSAGIYDPSGNAVDANSFLHIFMLRRSDADTLIKERALPGVPNPDARTYDVILDATAARSFRGGVAEGSSQIRELYVTNFGKGWPIGSDRENLSYTPYLFVRWGFQNGVPIVVKHVDACLEYWRPKSCE